jgi:hypothetical protein
MSVVDELHRLAELYQRGHISPAEYGEAKKQLLAAGQRQDSDATPDGALLLYRLMSSWLKRAAAAMVVVALLFGVVAGWSGLRYLDMRTQADAIKNTAIAQGFGVRIPDPRPTIERAVLEAKATAYGGLAAVTGVIALSTLLGALFVRPPSSPAEPQGASSPQPVAGRAAADLRRGVHGVIARYGRR